MVNDLFVLLLFLMKLSFIQLSDGAENEWEEDWASQRIAGGRRGKTTAAHQHSLPIVGCLKVAKCGQEKGDALLATTQ